MSKCTVVTGTVSQGSGVCPQGEDPDSLVPSGNTLAHESSRVRESLDSFIKQYYFLSISGKLWMWGE